MMPSHDCRTHTCRTHSLTATTSSILTCFQKKKIITHESIDESFFKAKPLWRHHFKVPTWPAPLCGPGFHMGLVRYRMDAAIRKWVWHPGSRALCAALVLSACAHLAKYWWIQKVATDRHFGPGRTSNFNPTATTLRNKFRIDPEMRSRVCAKIFHLFSYTIV